MTNEEAIWIIESIEVIDTPDVKKAYTLAIDALGKQIQRKPLYILHDGENEWYVCPRCKMAISESEYYCDCGQKLDWGAEK